MNGFLEFLRNNWRYVVIAIAIVLTVLVIVKWLIPFVLPLGNSSSGESKPS